MRSPIVAVVLALAVAVCAKEDRTPVKLAKPMPEQVEWADMELEMFVCLDPCTWQNREYDNHSTPLEKINPEKLDTDQWCRVAKSFGAGQILFVAKHTGGFCWWQTDTSKYSIKNTPWRGGKGDVVAELAASCRKHGLKLAIYVYPGDDQWGAHIGGGGRTRDPSKQAAYNKVYRQQLTEVLTRYGPISEAWFDGSCIIPVGDLLKKHAPKAMVLQGPHTTLRWVGNEAGWAPYPAWNALKSKDAKTGVSTAAHGDPNGDAWLPLEVDTVNVHPHHWFWKSKGRRLKSLDELMGHYYTSVGRGAVLLLNSQPDTTGLIPDEDVKQYAAFGAEIRRRFGKSLAETTGKGNRVELALPRPATVNHTVVMEDIREGERVRAYAIDGLVGDTWETLVEGSSIGHKRIDQFPPVEVRRIRLRVTKAAATPLIRRLAAFHVAGIWPDRLADAWWRLDEGQGKTVGDSAGSHTGEIRGATWATGREGKALDFDGKDDYVRLGTADVFARDFTVAAWIHPRSFPARGGTIVAKERNSLSDFNLRVYVAPGGKLGFWITDAQRNNIWPFETAAGTVPANEWTHVAATRSGTTHTLYIGGKKVATKSSKVPINHASRLEWRIGGRYPPAGSPTDEVGDFPFHGLIDDVRIYTRALRPDELANPSALPAPSMPPDAWKKAGAWTPDTVKAQWTTLEIDLSPHIAVAGQYEVECRKTGGSGDLEVRSAVLLLEGVETPGFATPLGRPLAWNINRTAAPTGKPRSTLLKLLLRAKGGACSGDVLTRHRR